MRTVIFHFREYVLYNILFWSCIQCTILTTKQRFESNRNRIVRAKYGMLFVGHYCRIVLIFNWTVFNVNNKDCVRHVYRVPSCCAIPVLHSQSSRPF